MSWYSDGEKPSKWLLEHTGDGDGCTKSCGHCDSCKHYKEMFEQDDYSGETFDVSWCELHETPIDDVAERTCEDYESED